MLMRSPLARDRRRPEGYIQPCQPTLAKTVPSGPGWIHELKHDGMRLIARKDGGSVRLWSRYGRSRTNDFPMIAAGLLALPVDQVLLDGEGLAHCAAGLPDFNRTLSTAGQRDACLIAFDLLAVDGEDLRPLPLLARRARLQALLGDAGQGLRFSEHMEGQDGEAMFRHACRLGLEGIVSKKLTAPYLSGRRSSWLKIKNPAYERPEQRCLTCQHFGAVEERARPLWAGVSTRSTPRP